MMIPGAKLADLEGLERRARRFMCGIATVAAITGLSFQADLLGVSPQYERQSWYLVSEHAGFTVTSVVPDEAACRKREEPSRVCHSGISMQAEPFGSPH